MSVSRRAILVLASVLTVASAWSNGVSWWDTHSLAERIEQAELIAVGHCVGEIGTIEREPTIDTAQWFYRGHLAIDEVLKGQATEGEIPFLLPASMPPSRYLKDGKLVRTGFGEGRAGLAIYGFGVGGLVEDAHKPAVWVLAHYTLGRREDSPATEELAVHGHASIQPVSTVPLFRAIVRQAPADELIGFLEDPDPGVRRLAVRYLRDRDEKGAFPKVAELLSDDDVPKRLSVSASVKLGGQEAIPFLRSLLMGEDEGVISQVAGAVAELGDVESLPRILELLEGAKAPRTRARMAEALGELADRRAMPGLVAALKDDGHVGGSRGAEVWSYAQEAIEALTHCRLSPNGDKAERWWELGQHLEPTAWEHFDITQTIQSLLVVGPRTQERADYRLQEYCGRAGAPGHGWSPDDRLQFWRRDKYNPLSAQQEWLRWLEAQGWDDYQTLPSQTDDELALRVELTASLDSGEPVLLRYFVRNTTDTELWLCKRYREIPAIWFAGGMGHYFNDGLDYVRRRPMQELSAEDFLLLPAGEQRFVVGKTPIWNSPRGDRWPRPRAIAPGLRFAHKGTSFGYDAWVGEVWAEPIEFPVEASE